MNFNSERSKKHEELSSSAVIGENFSLVLDQLRRSQLGF